MAWHGIYTASRALVTCLHASGGGIFICPKSSQIVCISSGWCSCIDFEAHDVSCSVGFHDCASFPFLSLLFPSFPFLFPSFPFFSLIFVRRPGRRILDGVTFNAAAGQVRQKSRLLHFVCSDEDLADPRCQY